MTQSLPSTNSNSLAPLNKSQVCSIAVELEADDQSCQYSAQSIALANAQAQSLIAYTQIRKQVEELQQAAAQQKLARYTTVKTLLLKKLSQKVSPASKTMEPVERYLQSIESRLNCDTAITIDELTDTYGALNRLVDKNYWSAPFSEKEAMELALSVLRNLSNLERVTEGIHPQSSVSIPRTLLILTRPLAAARLAISVLSSPVVSDPIFSWPAVLFVTRYSRLVYLDARSICPITNPVYRINTTSSHQLNYMGQIIDMILANACWQSRSAQSRYWYEQTQTGGSTDKLIMHGTICGASQNFNLGTILQTINSFGCGINPVLVRTTNSIDRPDYGVLCFSTPDELESLLTKFKTPVIVFSSVNEQSRWQVVFRSKTLPDAETLYATSSGNILSPSKLAWLTVEQVFYNREKRPGANDVAY